MSTPDRKLRVFLCHASQDKPVVRELYQKLLTEDWIEPWLDTKKLLPGQDWREEIELAVDKADNVIIFLSSTSINKEGFVQKEMRYAKEIALEKPEGSIFLIPIRLDECEAPRGLRSIQYVDYFGEKQEQSYSDLLESLKIRLEENIRKEAAEKAKRNEEELVRKQAAEKLARKTAEEKARKDAEEKLRLEAEERAHKELKERIEQEAREKVYHEMEERLRTEAEARLRSQYESQEMVHKQATGKLSKDIEKNIDQEEGGVFEKGIAPLGTAFKRLLDYLNNQDVMGKANTTNVAMPLTPEFRKNFKVPKTQDERPAAPLSRSEHLPPFNLLLGEQSARLDEPHINMMAGLIEKTISEFGIPARVVGFRIGPTVTQFAVQPGFIKKPGSNEDDAQQMKIRVAQIAALQKDLALALSTEGLRIEAPVPERSYVSIEVPNKPSSLVRLRPILESEAFSKRKLTSPLAIALGRDVSGQPLLADLGRMPHLLVAGQTGSGKSVCLTVIASCLAMNNTPEDMRLVMIDTKMVELLRFNGLPHLLGKVETDVHRILGVLRWLVVEMEHRYRLLEGVHARDVEAYNRKAKIRIPRVVVIVDELADLMLFAPDQAERNLVRLAQMARVTGIHLVVATQRTSTDVVTSLIKTNFPARLAFSVASDIDSRVILDTPGAETLLGHGDMLFLDPEVGGPVRAQGAWVTDQEIERIIAFWQKISTVSNESPPWETLLTEPDEDRDDALAEQAIQIVRSSQRASASLLQRRLRIGYPRAARLLDKLEEMGVIGPSQGGGRERVVLVEPDDDNRK